ncbi:hypothetical protein OE88DRAFT_1649199 [Heliocybe sulcata]|uniref:SWIM-type domain-containing protein n=1 Tax=Heliocybe sulcata TaxID=5364 RepID=A0A5C3MVW3_9AGAM|nr:hypothetical protein OE88DRAFT_1649199 [Heliocybe sulcata]
MPGNNQSKKVRPSRKQPWIIVTPEEARGDKVPLRALRQAAGIYTDQLVLTLKQKMEIEDLYTSNKVEDHQFSHDTDEQVQAATELACLRLDFDTRVSMGYRWTNRWVNTSGSGVQETKRILYQCHCAYDHAVKGKKVRHVPFDFTGCLVHVEVTYHLHAKHILRIQGRLDHNAACQAAEIAHGATLTDIQSKNRKMVVAHTYPGQLKSLEHSPYRWILKQADTRSLYRQFNQIQGVEVRQQAHINIDEWLDQDSPRYNKILADAVFHYSPRAAKGERFEICVAMDKMREAAWQYAHHLQIILDGTFGICNKKLLLFIFMGINGKRKGIPLAFLLFSAPSGNKQTSAGYNTDIIASLLDKWRRVLGARDGAGFEPLVAITDTDLMERRALIQIFPRIWLLICKFHLRQSWRNHRNWLIKGNSPVHMTVKNRLRRVEEALVTTLDINDARAIIEQEQQFLTAMLEGMHAGIAKNALEHLISYLLGYWVAAWLMKCPFEGVLPTTNHLESFNGVFKRKHLRRWQRNGKRLREDQFLKISVIHVLPAIFMQRTMEDNKEARRIAQICLLPGGCALLARQAENMDLSVLPTVAYLLPDETRHHAALDIVGNAQISTPSLSNCGLVFECYSTLATDFDPSPRKYAVFLGFNGTATCDCHDFTHRGRACKHIRAALIQSDRLRVLKFRSLPLIPIPTSPEHARALQASLSVSTEPASVQSPSAVQDASLEVEKILQELEESMDRENGAEEDSDDVEDEDIDDNESVATDAPEDDEAKGGQPSGFSYSFTDMPTGGSVKAGIDQQAVSRVFHELSQVASKFGNMAFYLRDVSSATADDVNNMITFKLQINLLSDALDQMILSCRDPVPSEDNLSTPTDRSRPSTPPPNKRPRLEIMGPSPEKAQQRKPSWAPH